MKQNAPEGKTVLYPLSVQYLGDIEEHLGETITEVGPDMKVPVNEFDGKVTYGARRKVQGMS